MFNGRRQPSHGGTSRMMREYQVRICERLGVKFPGPTRPSRQMLRCNRMSAFWGTAEVAERVGSHVTHIGVRAVAVAMAGSIFLMREHWPGGFF
jgi:hypothetical protein